MLPTNYQAKNMVTPVYANADMQLFELDYRLLTHSSTREVEGNLQDAKALKWSEIPEKFDFAFLGFHGGPGENGVVQGSLEMLDVPYNGSGVFTSALCMDKYKSGQFLNKKGFTLRKQHCFIKGLGKTILRRSSYQAL